MRVRDGKKLKRFGNGVFQTFLIFFFFRLKQALFHFGEYYKCLTKKAIRNRMEKSEWYDHFLKVLNDLLHLNEKDVEEINSNSVALNTSGDTNVYTVDKASKDEESQVYLNSDILPSETLEAISALGNCKVVGSDGLCRVS